MSDCLRGWFLAVLEGESASMWLATSLLVLRDLQLSFFALIDFVLIEASKHSLRTIRINMSSVQKTVAA